MSDQVWRDFCEEMRKYRFVDISCGWDNHKYIVALMLGAVEELEEYREANGRICHLKRVEEFGDLLFNAAELSNMLSDMGEKRYYEYNNMSISHPCN